MNFSLEISEGRVIEIDLYFINELLFTDDIACKGWKGNFR